MIIATFPTYTQVLPGFEQAISGLRASLLPIMSVLMIASLVGVAKEGYRAILFHLILLTILVGLAANWQPWFQQASTAVSTTFTGDQYDLGKQTERYLIRLQIKADQKDSDEGYVEAFFRAIMAGALLLLGYITKGIVLLFLVLQKILLTFAYALSPIFVGFFALRSTRGIAINYLMATVGLISWPLGFALSACGTFGLVQFFGNLGFFSVAGNVLTLNEAFFALLIIAVWLLVSTLISPVIISKVMATGAQAGSALLSGVANTVAAATGAAVTTGATLAGGAATAGAGGVAAAGSTGGGAPAASGGSSSAPSGSTSGGSGGVSAALRAATGAMLGGGASLVDAAMSGGNGHGAMSGAVASVTRGGGSGRSSGSSSAKGGSQPPSAQGGKAAQPNSTNQTPTSPDSTPDGGGSATPPPLPNSAGSTTTSSPAPPASAPPSNSNSSMGGTPIVMPPQTPNNPSAPSSAPVAGSPAAPATSTVSPTTGASSAAGSGGTRGGGPSAVAKGKVATAGTAADTSLDGEVARIIDFDTGKPITGDALPKPGN